MPLSANQFARSATRNVTIWNRHCFHTGLGPNLAVVGQLAIRKTSAFNSTVTPSKKSRSFAKLGTPCGSPGPTLRISIGQKNVARYVAQTYQVSLRLTRTYCLSFPGSRLRKFLLLGGMNHNHLRSKVLTM